MKTNSDVIIALCSQLCECEHAVPYEPAEWSVLAQRLLDGGMEPHDLLHFSDKDFRSRLCCDEAEIRRIKGLLDRGRRLFLEIGAYENMGIYIVTRADGLYPTMLKKRLGKRCPPLFYYTGDLRLASRRSVGFVGSRNVDERDYAFTAHTVTKVNHLGYGVVSGGAKGVDSIASGVSIGNGSFCVEYLADSLVQRLQRPDTAEAVQRGRLLMLSAIRPDAEFTAGIAMMRNQYIYAHSLGTVAVRCGYQKGGTWNGAAGCIRKGICPVFCWSNESHKGNMELIRMGAIPIDESWDGDAARYQLDKAQMPVQLSLFE